MLLGCLLDFGHAPRVHFTTGLLQHARLVGSVRPRLQQPLLLRLALLLCR